MEKHPRIIKPCAYCGKPFETTERREASARGSVCSRACNAKKNLTKHGMSGSRTYNTWAGMLQRCTNPKATKYPDYGAAGITVCPEWFSFQAFFADMGERPEGKTLDRIDGAKGYSADNCRWATPPEQSENLKTVKSFMFDGRLTSLPALSRETGLKKKTLEYRITRGWSPSAVVSDAKRGDRSRGV